MRDNIEWRVRLYEFLAAPAHIWLWVCARIVGGRFWMERVREEEKDTD
jgi:hypothetical protein